MKDAKSVRITLEPPTLRHAEAFLEAVTRSRKLHGPWANPPDSLAGYRAYLDKLQSPREAGYLVNNAVPDRIRLVPALTLSDDHAREFLEAFPAILDRAKDS